MAVGHAPASGEVGRGVGVKAAAGERREQVGDVERGAARALGHGLDQRQDVAVGAPAGPVGGDGFRVGAGGDFDGGHERAGAGGGLENVLHLGLGVGVGEEGAQVAENERASAAVGHLADERLDFHRQIRVAQPFLEIAAGDENRVVVKFVERRFGQLGIDDGAHLRGHRLEVGDERVEGDDAVQHGAAPRIEQALLHDVGQTGALEKDAQRGGVEPDKRPVRHGVRLGHAGEEKFRRFEVDRARFELPPRAGLGGAHGDSGGRRGRRDKDRFRQHAIDRQG